MTGVVWEGIDPVIQLMSNIDMANHTGLAELHRAFGGGTFTGASLRTVMVRVVGGPTKAKVGWQASIALSRLIKSGVVVRVTEGRNAAAWDHTYQITGLGLSALGVDETGDEEGDDVDDLFMRGLRVMRSLMSRMEAGKFKRLSKATGCKSDVAEGLRVAIASGWVEVHVKVTPEGEAWLREQAVSEGKATKSVGASVEG